MTVRSKKPIPFQRLGLISSQAFSICNFREDLVRVMVRQGVTVFALAPDFDESTLLKVKALGATPVSYFLERSGTNPLSEIRSVLSLYCCLRRLGVDATFSFFIKPVLYGGIASWLAGVPLRYSMIEGAGFIYSEEAQHSLRRRLLRWVVTRLLRFCMRLSRRVFLLNRDDAELFVTSGLWRSGKVVQLPGVGVDLDRFSYSPPVYCPMTFVLVARLIKEKGVYDFIAAARTLRANGVVARFLLLGAVDECPGAVPLEKLARWVAEGLVEWPGHVSNIKDWVASASVFVLPSYYREGLPRSIQEAMSLGKPIITTDWVGCRDTVQHGVNGFLVPVRSPELLAEAMLRFVQHPSLVERMGRASRHLAEQRYDVSIINGALLSAL